MKESINTGYQEPFRSWLITTPPPRAELSVTILNGFEKSGSIFKKHFETVSRSAFHWFSSSLVYSKFFFFNSKYQDYPFGNQIVLSKSYYGLYAIWWYSIIHVHEVSTLKQTFRTFETVKLDRPKWKCRYFSRWTIHFRIQKIVQT